MVYMGVKKRKVETETAPKRCELPEKCSYVNLLDYRSHRKEHLRKHYYFECACARCRLGDERAMFCVSCAECGGDAVYLGGAAENEDEGEGKG